MSFRALVFGARFWRGISALTDRRLSEKTNGNTETNEARVACPTMASGNRTSTASSARLHSTGGVDLRMFCHSIHTGIGEVAVRPIAPADADKAQAFVAALSQNSRYLRFFHTLKSLPPSMLKRFIGIDQQIQVVLVGLAVVQGRETMIAEARYCVSGDHTTAEIAISVADEWQRRGIATALLNMLERIASTNDITQFTAQSFAVNETFRKFARACGFESRRDTDPAYLRFQKPIASFALRGCGDFAAR